MSILTIEDIKRLNSEQGGHFFDRDAMRFFNSRVLSRVMVYPYDNGELYFVTSERYEDEPRKYTLRSICVREWDARYGRVEQVGEFQQFSSAGEAYRYAESNYLR